jgi:23S rRNA (uracil1939-C5)-methyltransferase
MSTPLINVESFALAHGGESVSRPLPEATAEQHDARKIFVRGLIPGETARVRVTEEQRNFRRAELEQVLSPHPKRVSPPCPYFGSCGGCDYQFMPIELQREQKRSMVETMLKRQAGIEPVKGVLLVGHELPAFHYRKRIGLHISPAAGPKPAQLGFYREGTGSVVDISSCTIASTALNIAVAQLREIIAHLEGSFAGLVVEEHEGEIFVAGKLREDALEHVELSGSPAVAALTRTFENCAILYRERSLYSQYHGQVEDPSARAFPIGHFSQVNEEGNSLLQDLVCAALSNDRVTDLFAGAGNFAIKIALTGKAVTAIELDPELIRLGRIAGFKAGLSERQLSFVESSCEQYVKSAPLERTVLLDPPRSGAAQVCQSLSPQRSPQVTYVSCSLPTLCRDAKTLVQRGYSLVQCWVVDMFSQTHHVETVSVFETK